MLLYPDFARCTRLVNIVTVEAIFKLHRPRASFVFPKRVEWRRGRDSNPRCLLDTPVFKTGALNHYATSPSFEGDFTQINYNIFSLKNKTALSLEKSCFLANLMPTSRASFCFKACALILRTAENFLCRPGVGERWLIPLSQENS